MRRIFAVLLTLAVAVTVCSCESAETEVPVVTTTKAVDEALGTGTLSLQFSASDSLNPYEAQTLANQQISSLLYDGLVCLDEDLNPTYRIAQRISLSGKKCTVTLKSVMFSDGTAITADDVVYSIKRAKEAKYSGYADQLKNIVSYSASGDGTFVFTTEYEDINIASILDFPIIKSGSEDMANDDGKEIPPIGAGRYVYNEDSGVYTLTGNSKYYRTVPKNTVYLVNTPDEESLDFNIRSGNVNICYSGINIEDLPSMNGNIYRAKQTNFVFIGMNTQEGILSRSDLRKAVSACLDRDAIIKEAFYTYAKGADNLFPSGYSTTKELDGVISTIQNAEACKSYLKSAGYENGITLTLLYNKDNLYHADTAELIISQAAACGITVKADGRNYKNYKACVESGNYTMYLGEVKLSKSLDFTTLINKDNNYNIIETEKINTTITSTQKKTASLPSGATVVNTTGAATTEADNIKVRKICDVYESYMKGKIKASELVNAFIESMPFVPVCWRMGVVSSSSSVSPVAVATASDAYYNIELLTVE